LVCTSFKKTGYAFLEDEVMAVYVVMYITYNTSKVTKLWCLHQKDCARQSPPSLCLGICSH